MKNILFLTLIIAVSLTACKKSDKAIVETELTGNWELRQLNTGFTGKVTNYSAGNGHTLKFSGNAYKILDHDTVEKSGTFVLIREISQLTKTVSTRIIYDNDRNTTKTFLEVNGNNLSIFYDAYDAGSKSYQRIDGLVID
jgi:hypothetical protein